MELQSETKRNTLGDIVSGQYRTKIVRQMRRQIFRQMLFVRYCLSLHGCPSMCSPRNGVIL